MQRYHDLIDTSGRPYDIMQDLDTRTKEVMQERIATYQEKLKAQAKIVDLPQRDIKDRFDHKRMVKKLCKSWKNKCDYELIAKNKSIAEFEDSPLFVSRKVIRKYL